ncbi:UDP-N-acetylglucosamine transferase subunit ALG14 homolog [Lethenteron reissneri]|uniref:UDP-N-acetylglucosamine transferase subunit ALG14 homolog n=1 Tax=Lethenteron reissneri TaxID=7753 RepID=UPI002AB6D0C3|nr:UDP-N-acetylglucosamine transferase subunit ALG14 homolog [Lethenteron reissneri]
MEEASRSNLLLVSLPLLILFFILVSRRIMRETSPAAAARLPVSLLVVAGSGGHTTEMLRALSALPAPRYSPRLYLMGGSDPLSRAKILAHEETWGARGGEVRVEEVLRCREVAEPLGRSLLKAAVATVQALWILLTVSQPPQLVLCNGPGTCLPILLAAWIFSLIRLPLHLLYGPPPPGGDGGSSATRWRPRLVFLESVCRVHSLSLSARLSRRLVDHLVVQWPQIQQQQGGGWRWAAKTTYLGRVV